MKNGGARGYLKQLFEKIVPDDTKKKITRVWSVKLIILARFEIDE